MRNLILFVQRFYVFFFFLLLLALSLFILVNNNLYQRSAFINSSNALTGELYTFVSDVRGYFSLGVENDRLREENARLKSIMRNQYYVDTITSVFVNDTVLKQHYSYISARVINNSVDKAFNYITLDKGRIHGVEKNDGVICDDGVVGIVVNVSERFSTVMSVLNSKIRIPPKIDTFMYFGSLVWDESSIQYAQLIQINRFAPVKVGQKVFTSGFSEHFPENISIGSISEINLDGDAEFYDIQVKLSTNFTSLRTVYIVQNLFKQQILDLEAETRKEDKDGH